MPPISAAIVRAHPASAKISGMPVAVSPKNVIATSAWLTRSTNVNRVICVGAFPWWAPRCALSRLARKNHRIVWIPKNVKTALIMIMKYSHTP